jgi:toluene monooxygenase system ferredoxin subunit
MPSRIAAAALPWDGEMIGLVVEGRRVLLVRVDGCLHAYEDRCAHLGLALSDGALCDGVITCAAHQYQYDARTGCGVNPAAVRLREFRVEAAGDDAIIEIDVPEVRR